MSSVPNPNPNVDELFIYHQFKPILLLHPVQDYIYMCARALLLLICYSIDAAEVQSVYPSYMISFLFNYYNADM